MADAELHQMPDQLSKLAALRLTEYYRLVDLGVIIPGATALQPKVTEHEVRAASNGTHPQRSSSTTEDTETTRKLKDPAPAANQSMLEESSNVSANADAALAFFADEDEDEPGTDA